MPVSAGVCDHTPVSDHIPVCVITYLCLITRLCVITCLCLPVCVITCLCLPVCVITYLCVFVITRLCLPVCPLLITLMLTYRRARVIAVRSGVGRRLPHHLLVSRPIRPIRCVALRCVALRCVALRCVALRCVPILLSLHPYLLFNPPSPHDPHYYLFTHICYLIPPLHMTHTTISSLISTI